MLRGRERERETDKDRTKACEASNGIQCGPTLSVGRLYPSTFILLFLLYYFVHNSISHVIFLFFYTFLIIINIIIFPDNVKKIFCRVRMIYLRMMCLK